MQVRCLEVRQLHLDLEAGLQWYAQVSALLGLGLLIVTCSSTRPRVPREVTGTTMWTSLGAVILSIPHDQPLHSTEWVDVFPVLASPLWTFVFGTPGLNGLARLDGKIIHWWVSGMLRKSMLLPEQEGGPLWGARKQALTGSDFSTQQSG